MQPDNDTSHKPRKSRKSHKAHPRYLFYSDQYMKHMQSLNHEKKVHSNIKMEEIQQQHGMTPMEVQFVKKAVEVLSQSRQVLMYTYVLAFYLKKNNESIILEQNQEDLDEATELLASYLEQDITADIEDKVKEWCEYCESRKKQVLDHAREGYETDIWEFEDE